jgi:hypothetical protein
MYTKNVQTFVVPTGVTSLTISAIGATGGSNTICTCTTGGVSSKGFGGYGGKIQATLTVTPGQTLYVRVGGLGSVMPACNRIGVGGYNGGLNATTQGAGGGGATDIRNATNYRSAGQRY